MDSYVEYRTLRGRTLIVPRRPPHLGPGASAELLLEWSEVMEELGELEEAAQAAADAVQLSNSAAARQRMDRLVEAMSQR